MPRKKTASVNKKASQNKHDNNQHELVPENVVEATTALLDSAKTGNERLLTKVLEQWAAQIEPCFFGHALKDAAEENQQVVIRILLAQVGARISEKDKGMALRLSATAGHLDSVKKLLEICFGDIESVAKSAAFFNAVEGKYFAVAREIFHRCWNEIDQDTKQFAFDTLAENEELTFIKELLEKSRHSEKQAMVNSVLYKSIEKIPLAIYVLLAEKCGDLFSDEMWFKAVKKAATSEDDVLFQRFLAKIPEALDLDDRLELLENVLQANYPDRAALLFANNDTVVPEWRAPSALKRAAGLGYFESVKLLMQRYKKMLLPKDIAEAYAALKTSEKNFPEIQKRLFEPLSWSQKLRHENVFRVCGYYIKALFNNMFSSKKEEASVELSQTPVESSDATAIVLTEAVPTLRFSGSEASSEEEQAIEQEQIPQPTHTTRASC